MAPKYETNQEIIVKLLAKRQAYAVGVAFIETRGLHPKLRAYSEKVLKINYWQSFAEIYPKTELVEINQGEFILSTGEIIRRDISTMSDKEKLDKVVPFELITQINNLTEI